MYTGKVVEIPIGSEGLTGSRNPSGLHPGYLTEASNVSFYDGTIRKEGGATKYNSSAISGAPTILGGWDHQTNALAQRMIVAASDGKLYKDTGGGTFAVTLKTGLSAQMRPFFVEGGKEAAANNRKLFIFTGTDTVQVLADDGATTANIATPPTDWSGANQPSFGLIHAYRLLAGGNANDPHRIYYSVTTNHEDFTSAGSGTIAIYPGEGEGLVGGISFQNYAVVFKKPLGIYLIDMRNATNTNWTVQRISRSIGLASPWALVQTESDVIFVDTAGNIQSLVNSMSNADVEGRNLSQVSFMEPLLRSELNLSKLNTIRGVYYVAKREVHFAYTHGGAAVNDSRLVLDLYRPDKLRYRISPRDICTAMWLRKDANGIQRIMVGDNAGFVRELDRAARNKDGVAYPASAKSVPIDFGFADPSFAHRIKNAEFLEIIYEPTTFNAVSVRLEWDGQRAQTVNYTLSPSGLILGSFNLGDTSIFGGGEYLSTVRRRLTGGGKLLTVAISNTGLNQDFSIARLRIYFNLGNE